MAGSSQRGVLGAAKVVSPLTTTGRWSTPPSGRVTARLSGPFGDAPHQLNHWSVSDASPLAGSRPRAGADWRRPRTIGLAGGFGMVTSATLSERPAPSTMATDGKPRSRHGEALVFQTRNPPRSEPVAPPQPASPAASWSARHVGASGVGGAVGVGGGAGVADDHGTIAATPWLDGVRVGDASSPVVAGGPLWVPPVARQPATRNTTGPIASRRRSIQSPRGRSRLGREAGPEL